ncbi:Hypothetical protein D9617_18g033230 [Elsinoe fawcettii]|nr:Hypothetical protein D9617_18g033230 [Elsinoe fawcettii]
MSKDLMSTAPGGESDQSDPFPLPPVPAPVLTINTRYSSIDTFNKPHATSTGQLSQAPSDSSEAPSHSLDPSQTKEHQERGEQTAANIRYGQAISEQGMGGQTTTSSGSVGKEGHGGVKDEGAGAEGGRVQQGYSERGEGDDIGA